MKTFVILEQNNHYYQIIQLYQSAFRWSSLHYVHYSVIAYLNKAGPS